MNEREKLLLRIQVVSFALVELNLFLDTHPTNQEALKLHNQYSRDHDALVCEYEEKYGPLKATSMNRSKVWAWVKDPWPWDYMGGR